MNPSAADPDGGLDRGVSRRDALKTLAAVAALAAAPAGVVAAPPADAGAWDLTALYADDAAWERARQAVLAALPGLARYRGTLGTTAGALEAAYAAASDLTRAALRLETYAHLQADADLRVGAAQERRQRAAERDRYLALLAAGGSDYGYVLLRDAGLDLASPAPYRAVVDAFAATLDQAEALLA